jgi:hypothetical protein
VKTFGWWALGLGGLLLLGLFASVVLFLYAVLFTGPWLLFLWGAGLSVALIVAIQLVSLSVLDDKRQLDVSAMLAELIGGAFGWIWLVLAVASLVLLLKAMFFVGLWSAFLVCLLASAWCKWLTRFSITRKQAAMFKRELVERGLTKAEARQALIARAREIIQQRKAPPSGTIQ